MKLIQFRVYDFRSINDSGEIHVSKNTALVGRNESGKTNLLLALQSLNPVGRRIESLDPVKNFPRHRHISEATERTIVVSTLWELDSEEQNELVRLFPRSQGVKQVTINRSYKPDRYVTFNELSSLSIDTDRIRTVITHIKQAVSGKTKRSSLIEISPALTAAIERFQKELNTSKDKPTVWVETARNASAQFLQDIETAGYPADDLDTIKKTVSEISDYCNEISVDSQSEQKAKDWLISRMPIFVFLDEYPALNGHQDLQRYLERNSNKSDEEIEADKNFAKLLKVAGLNAEHLNELLSSNHEHRQLLTNRAGAAVTNTLKRLWKDRSLKVRFNLDANHFDTLVSDPNNDYDVEVNFNERSRGFKWFFSFYMTFAADTNEGGEADNAILLLDEPGLFLHARGQEDLISHFAEDFRNQIIYTTHSPFMIPVDDIASVRTVNIAPDTGTRVTNDPTGDEKTLFPLRTALGYETSQALFIGKYNLVVEGITDYWYLTSISEYLREQEPTGVALPRELVITPAGGAQKVSYMISLLTSNQLRVLVLLDSEQHAQNTARDIVKRNIINQQFIISVNSGLETESERDADIEDLIDPVTFNDLVSESYKNELNGRKLHLNPKIPRVTYRYEEAFKNLDLNFNKTRVARLFLSKMSEQPMAVLTQTTLANMTRLFREINKQYEKLVEQKRHGGKLT